MATFPELHGTSSANKTKTWSIRVLDKRQGSVTVGVIETTHGYLQGKMQVNQKTISEGKNIGKSNETTPLQQAVKEAQACWVKKLESGYAEALGPDGHATTATTASTTASTTAPTASTTATPSTKASRAATKTEAKASCKFQDNVPGCMLAHDYTKRGKSIKFPCFVQRKFDGTRCIGVPNEGLFSRNKKPFPHMHHIMNEINTLNQALTRSLSQELEEFPLCNTTKANTKTSKNTKPSKSNKTSNSAAAAQGNRTVVLDGELYSETLTFQELVGAVKRASLKEGDDKQQLKVKYYVYDIIDDKPFHQRLDALKCMFALHKFKHLKLVETVVCDSEDHMKQLHAQYVEEGYEGIMLRNTNGLYKGTRSVDLQKYKHFFDDEFEVVGFNQGEGLELGCVVWVCKTKQGKTFACRPRGSRESRAALFQSGNDYIGKMLTVRFQELTDIGIPRFPVGIAFRDLYE